MIFQLAIGTTGSMYNGCFRDLGWSQGVMYPFDVDDKAQKQAIVQLVSEHCNPSAAGLPVPPLARWMRTCPSGQRLSAYRAARKPDLNSSAARCHHVAWITKQINQVELSIRQLLSLTFTSSPNICAFSIKCASGSPAESRKYIPRAFTSSKLLFLLVKRYLSPSDGSVSL